MVLPNRLNGFPLFKLGLAVFALSLATTGLLAADDEELLLSPERVGAVHRGSGYEELRQIYGAERVRDHLVQVGEGFVCRGSKIEFPGGDSLEITWIDETSRRRPDTVAVLGDRWATQEGLRLGSTLQELEAMNGAPFSLSGFGWDYGGTVGTWNAGALTYLAAGGPPRLIIRLSPARAAYDRITGDQRAVVTGDGALVSSAHDAMQALTPQVSQIIVDFAAGDCAAYFQG
jgi:hypothetical protein